LLILIIKEGEKHVQGVVERREDVADPPEREVGNGSSREGGDQVQDIKRKTSSLEANAVKTEDVAVLQTLVWPGLGV
jgi:hypothetical protein